MILTTSSYVFFDYKNAESDKEIVKAKGKELGLLGTLLLAPEGVNCFLAGDKNSIYAFKKWTEDVLGFPVMNYKESFTELPPFKRFEVKFKREIIKMGIDGIAPHKFTGKYVKPQELKTWYDQGKEFVILDTRNDYEVHMGRFKNAVAIPQVKNFHEFAARLDELPSDFKDKTVVTYCTGGVRCEKLSAHLLQHKGYKDVYQIDGGILKYFEEVGGDHWEGECFVFDKRLGIDPALAPMETYMCPQCRHPLKAHELQDEVFHPDRGCRYCLKS